MKNKNNIICNWCLKKINIKNSFYTFKINKDFHQKCFKEMANVINKQLNYEMYINV